MKSTDLTLESIKILGINYSYNEKVFTETNYLEIITNIEKLVNIWRMRNLTIIEKNAIFDTLVMSKVVFLSFLTNVPRLIILKIRKDPI